MNLKGVHYTFWILVQFNSIISQVLKSEQHKKGPQRPPFENPNIWFSSFPCHLNPAIRHLFPALERIFYYNLHRAAPSHCPIAPDRPQSIHIVPRPSLKEKQAFYWQKYINFEAMYILDTQFQIKPFVKRMREVIRPSTQYSCKSELLLTKESLKCFIFCILFSISHIPVWKWNKYESANWN